MADPYLAPKAPIDQPRNEDPPTIGYLVGGVIQLVGGAAFLILGVGGWYEGAVFGLFIAFFGLRTIIRYRARRSRVSSPHA